MKRISNLSEKDILIRNNDLVMNKIDNEVILLSIQNEEYYHLNESGSLIFDYLKEPRTVEDIIDYLFAEYEVNNFNCIPETKEYLSELIDLKVLAHYAKKIS